MHRCLVESRPSISPLSCFHLCVCGFCLLVSLFVDTIQDGVPLVRILTVGDAKGEGDELQFKHLSFQEALFSYALVQQEVREACVLQGLQGGVDCFLCCLNRGMNVAATSVL